MKTNSAICHAINFMPSDQHMCEILRERATHIAKEDIKEKELKNSVNYIKFKLNEHEYYGIPYQNIQEVIHKMKITQLPNMPDYIAGVINHRGALLTILDLKKLMRLNTTEHQDSYDIIIVKENDTSIGILVDNIEGSNEYDSQMIKEDTAYTGIINPQYILGLHQGYTTILNIKNIVSDLKQLLGKK